MGENHQKDLDLAQRICRELKAGNSDAVQELYERFQNLFLSFALRRLHDPSPDKARKVLSSFWLELLNSRAICSYAGRASLQTYLLVILSRRIMDQNTRTRKRRARFADEENPDQAPALEQSPEEKLILSQRREMLAQALAALENISPRDASLVRMHLEGLSYEQMAHRELAGGPSGAGEIKKKCNAVKKQFTRPGTGSLAKFKILLDRILKKHGLEYEDLLD